MLFRSDVIVAPSFRGNVLRITNLTGHPCVAVPNRFSPVEGDDSGDARRRSPGSVTFVGRMYGDDVMLRVADAFQQNTDFHLKRPPIL